MPGCRAMTVEPSRMTLPSRFPSRQYVITCPITATVVNPKMNERCWNVVENKGPLWKTCDPSWNLIENKGTYKCIAGMSLKTNELHVTWTRRGLSPLRPRNLSGHRRQHGTCRPRRAGSALPHPRLGGYRPRSVWIRPRKRSRSSCHAHWNSGAFDHRFAKADQWVHRDPRRNESHSPSISSLKRRRSGSAKRMGVLVLPLEIAGHWSQNPK
jgi:hypothetical protein